MHPMGFDFIEPKVFISYTRRDPLGNALSAQLVEALASECYRGYRDQNQLAVGDEWHGVLDEQIHSCQAAIVLLTKGAVESPWILPEVHELMGRWRRARNNGGLFPLLILLFDDVQKSFNAEWQRELAPINVFVEPPGGGPRKGPVNSLQAPVQEEASLSNRRLEAGVVAAGQLAAYAKGLVDKLKFQCVSLKPVVCVNGDAETIKLVHGIMANRNKIWTLRSQTGWGDHVGEEATYRHVVFDLISVVRQYAPSRAGSIGTIGAAERVRPLGRDYFAHPQVTDLFDHLSSFMADEAAARRLQETLEAKVPGAPAEATPDELKLRLREVEIVRLHLLRAWRGLVRVGKPQEVVHGGKSVESVNLNVVRNEVARIRRKALTPDGRKLGPEVAVFYMRGEVDPSVLDAIRGVCQGSHARADVRTPAQPHVPALCVLFASVSDGGNSPAALGVIGTKYDGEVEAELKNHLDVTWDELRQVWPELPSPAQEF